MFGEIAATMLPMPNRPAPPLVVDEAELAALRTLARAGRTEQRLGTRARIVLRAVEGQPNNRIAAELRVAPMTVLLWRRRFERDRTAGLRDALRPGRERIYSRADRDRAIALTLSPPPAGLSH
jgi:putative transposase